MHSFKFTQRLLLLKTLSGVNAMCLAICVRFHLTKVYGGIVPALLPLHPTLSFFFHGLPALPTAALLRHSRVIGGPSSSSCLTYFHSGLPLPTS